MPYDPAARRETPLALKLKERIRGHGPLSISEYMHACLQDEQHGYYRSQTAIGARGDFVTAPEISQVFGELIGLWCAVVWQQMSCPAAFNLVELGPGRGTLMRDALRATRIVPGFLAACHVHLVETNSALQTVQRATLGDTAAIEWHVTIGTIPTGPSIVIANEFLDTFPIEQFEFVVGDWHERTVEMDGAGRLCFGRRPLNELRPAIPIHLVPAEGAVFERSPSLGSFLETQLAPRAVGAPLAAVFLDYGHVATGFGETLQAVRDHRAEHPLTSPGEADLTAQVDFEEVLKGARAAGLTTDGPMAQAEFMGALGIMQRASRLMTANPARAHEIEVGVARLMAVPGMGDRFKVIGFRTADLPQLPGL